MEERREPNPAPWAYRQGSGVIYSQAPTPGRDNVVARYVDPWNAPLLVAAPQMAEALRGVLGYARSRAEDITESAELSAEMLQHQERNVLGEPLERLRRRHADVVAAAKDAERAVDAAIAALKAAGVEP